ncbi:class C sortase [Rarobacter incanus]|uniref:Sortase A n=1 Tax=Rarobacter incanus TaxID=153494 RepID=A0A542SMK5_9MICO|nr:class C sortase [Rarobacter incanus]TQK75859.1 sortase A [Rarobacter incanus]
MRAVTTYAFPPELSVVRNNQATMDQPRPRHRSARRRWTLSWSALLITILGLGGASTFTYPQAAAWFAQREQSMLVDSYSQQVEQGTNPDATVVLRQAEEYNAALSAGAIVDGDKRIPEGDGTSTDNTLDYWKLLDAVPSGVMARIEIPSIDVDLPIYHGTADDTLEHGIGHLQGTSLPVGGVGTHAVLTGHRGLASSTLFTNLDKVKIGDTFTIEVFGRVLEYRVDDIKIVQPDETKALRQQPGRDIVTLVTCTPLGINTQRILVTGERVLPTPQEAIDTQGQKSNLPKFPWWAVWMGAIVVAGAGYVAWAGVPVARKRKKKPADQRDAEPSEEARGA